MLGSKAAILQYFLLVRSAISSQLDPNIDKSFVSLLVQDAEGNVHACSGTFIYLVVYCEKHGRPYMVVHIWSSIYGRPYMVVHVWSSIYMVVHVWSSMYGRPCMVVHRWSSMCGRSYMVVHIICCSFLNADKLGITAC